MVARESYEEFAENLQREIEEDTGIRFGIIERHQFAQLSIPGDDGQPIPLGHERSNAVFDHLQVRGYVDKTGRIQDTLRTAIRNDTLDLPGEFDVHHRSIVIELRKLSGRLDIRDADERRTVRSRQAILAGKEFKALWDRIKHKTTYRVRFDNDDLIMKSTEALQDEELIPRTRIEWRTAGISIGEAGVQTTETDRAATVPLDETDIELPDLLTELQDRTQLTRRSVYRILVASGRLNDFKKNPQQFIEIAARAINGQKREALVDGIKYRRIGDDAYFAQELFEQEELTGYLKNMQRAEKSVYDNIIYESETEARFADDLEKNAAVKVYAKLPNWFKVPTPLGSYNPDWAILLDTEEGERLYLVVETKASTLVDNLRTSEEAKIKCGRAHFRALRVQDNPVQYKVESTVNMLLAKCHGN